MSVWDSVVDQKAACAMLKEAAAHGSPSMTHAWLITGPPGSGRSTAAVAFAAALQCQADPPGCGHCNDCATVMANSHRDVTRVATDKIIISLDEVTHLLERAQQAPVQGRWQIIIVEDADRMAERTSNLLLKSIEEPPPRTVWILCAPSPNDVLVTIRSRCRNVNLKIPGYDAVARLLVQRHGVDPAIAHNAAHIAQAHIGMANALVKNPEVMLHRRYSLELVAGVRSVTDAVVVAGQLVWYAQNHLAGIEERRAVAYATGKKKASKKSVKELDDDPDYAEQKAKLLSDYGYDSDKNLPVSVQRAVRDFTQDYLRRSQRREKDVLDRIMLDLLSLYRDVYTVQSGADAQLINTDMEAVISQLASQSTPDATVARMDVIAKKRQDLTMNVSPLLLMESLLVALRPQAATPFCPQYDGTLV